MTLTMLLLDPVYLSVLCGSVGGGDMNGSALLMPGVVARVMFGAIGLINFGIAIRLVYPSYTASFAKIRERGERDKMKLETKRLLLRPWEKTRSDAEELYRYAKDPQVGPIAGWPPHTSVENSLELIESVLSAPQTYAVVLKETGKPVGSVGIVRGTDGSASMDEGEAEIGYWIGVPYWGQGLIPEAVRELQRYCFEELGCTALWCGYFDGNRKSQRTQEKCGFVYHHTEDRIFCKHMNGYRKEHFTRITKARWQARCCPPVVRSLGEHEIPAALALAWQVFEQFEAPGYSEEGIREFRATLDNPERIGAMKLYGAYQGSELVGMLAMRKPQHVSLFFVHANWHGMGIGRALFNAMRNDYDSQVFTVNASPYAVRIYERLGFSATDTEQMTNGIRYTPMRFEAANEEND